MGWEWGRAADDDLWVSESDNTITPTDPKPGKDTNVRNDASFSLSQVRIVCVSTESALTRIHEK